MPIKTFSIKGFLFLGLLAGLTTFLLASPAFAREPIRTVTGTVTKVSDGDTIHVTTPEKTKLRVRLPKKPIMNYWTIFTKSIRISWFHSNTGKQRMIQTIFSC